jgi:hypothetical protein
MGKQERLAIPSRPFRGAAIGSGEQFKFPAHYSSPSVSGGRHERVYGRDIRRNGQAGTCVSALMLVCPCSCSPIEGWVS